MLSAPAMCPRETAAAEKFPLNNISEFQLGREWTGISELAACVSYLTLTCTKEYKESQISQEGFSAELLRKRLANTDLESVLPVRMDGFQD